MFRQRTSSQKPGDDLLANFRQQFPEVAAAVSSTAAAPPARTVTTGHPDIPASGPERSHSLSHEAFRDQDPTPRASNDPWRFTPSLLDPGSFSFTNFANQPPGYYTPTPGGTNTLYHPQAGDLHTPTLGLGMGLGTPLSMPNSDGAVHSGAGTIDMAAFHHPFHAQPFQQHFNPFIQPPPPQPSFAPSSFMHQDTGYETMDQDGSPMDSDHADERVGSIDGNFQSQAPMVAFQARQFGMPMSVPLPASAEKFRFHAALNAPTAMIKHADEIPVTYLNKGQAYSLSVVDTAPTLPIIPGTRFRTFVRVSFEDEQQRQKPGVCWSLWKEGRGTNEAHQRGGKLQAVEYVEAGQPAEGDDKKTRIELETSSFDGFSVIWTPGVNGAVECNIAVRFNFLSTDFSHSKGVKGIPVRLCAKTQQLPADASSSPAAAAADKTAEICYCKVKLFRDHGAERKLSNDVAHVRKTIDKLKQQIAQAESGMKDFGKRKRSSGAQMKSGPQRPGKIQKHKRTWSMSSASSAGGGGPRVPLEEDLQFKLQTLQEMFSSTRPVSVLYLRGEDLDDPDAHPVSLPGESAATLDLSRVESRESHNAWRSERSSIAGSSLVSPSPSSLSLHSSVGGGGNNNKPQWQDYQIGGGGGNTSAGPSSDPSSRDPLHQQHQHHHHQPTRVKQIDEAGNLTGWIEALGVDASYRPPQDRPTPKPVACFYVARVTTPLSAAGITSPGNIASAIASPDSHGASQGSQQGQQEMHRAVYLAQRTVRELVSRLAAKWRFDPSRVARTVRVVQPRGLEVEVDDDVVRELPEGMDMTMEVVEVGGTGNSPPVKREWEMVVDSHEPGHGQGGHEDAPGEADLPSPESNAPPGLEVRLRW